MGEKSYVCDISSASQLRQVTRKPWGIFGMSIDGLTLTKEDLEQSLRAHHAANKETRSGEQERQKRWMKENAKKKA